MFHINKPLAKPLPCNQVWEDMIAADGGRICKGCGKLVVDFRKHTWYEIEQAQRESIVPLCGIYNNKQLDNWAVDVSTSTATKESNLVKLSATLFALFQLAPLINLTAQTTMQQHVVPSQQKSLNKTQQKHTSSLSLKRIISGTVVLQTNDTTRQPLPNTIVSVVCGDKLVQYTTDSMGRFTLDLTSVYKKLRDTFEIVVAHPLHMRNTIEFARSNIKPSQNNIIDIVIEDVPIIGKKEKRIQVVTSISTFYATPTIVPVNKHHKPGSKLKAWWWRVIKKKKEN